MRLIHVLSSVALVVIGVVVHPATVSALTCVRPWGTDDLAGARMALTEGFGAGEFDGFLVAKVVDTLRGPSGEVSDLGLAVSVAFEADVPRDVHIAVGAQGPLVTFQAGHTYFLTLHKGGDTTLPPLFVHPCGPAFEVSSSTELNTLLGLRNDETVVDAGYLSDLQQSLPGDGLGVPVLALAALAVLIAIGLVALPRGRASVQDS